MRPQRCRFVRIFVREALLSFSDICNYNTDAHRNSKECRCRMGFLRIFAYKVFQYKQKFNMRNLEFITKACGIIRTGDAVCFNKASIAATAAAAAVTLPSHSLVSCSVIMGLTTMWSRIRISIKEEKNCWNIFFQKVRGKIIHKIGSNPGWGKFSQVFFPFSRLMEQMGTVHKWSVPD